jgi:hypothetical protein
VIAAGVPFVTISLIAAVTLWAIYGFELRSLPEVTGAIPLPAATHLEIYRSLQEHYRLGHPAFLMGQNSDQGWWYYFPVALGVKTPLPILILLGLALILLIRRPRSMNLALVLFPPVYMITALLSSVDIGYRHLLPMLPFIHIFIGSMLCGPLSASASRLGNYLTLDIQRIARIVMYALLLWLVVGTALVYPYPLTYFNELAGGPEGGYRWLVDSNLDWGQNLWQLRDWIRTEGTAQRPERAERTGRLYYSHFSPARPEVYGVSADWLPPDPRAVPFAPFDPAPGFYAIGATTLQGVYTPDVNTFAFFRARQPEDILGHALFLYRVPEHPVPDWVAVCFDVPLDEGQIRANFGQPDMRLVFYDCNQSQVYATGEEGRFLLPPETSWPDGASLVLQARYADGRPAYKLLRSSERPIPGLAAEPVSVDGPLSFLGYELNQVQFRGDDQVILRTWWQVDQVPDRPLSIMAHLSGPDGDLVAVGDGLGVPVEGWGPGDRIMQIHRLPLPPDLPAGDYTLHTGGYWLDTLERWSIHLADGTSSDHFSLDKITVLD